MQKASVWAEKVMIPTYEIGEAEKNPIFLENVCIREAAERYTRIRRLKK